jgi:hypothetical protein
MTTTCLSLLCLPILPLAVQAPGPATPQQVNAAIIYRALDEETAFEFVDKPLKDALAEIAKQHHFNMVLDPSALGHAASRESSDVSLILNGVRLRSALRILLEPYDLDYSIQDEVMMISTVDQARRTSGLLSYDVSGLLEDGDIETLVVAVREQIRESPGAAARISGYRNLLLVTGNRHVHESVQRTLKVLNNGLKVVPAEIIQN